MASTGHCAAQDPQEMQREQAVVDSLDAEAARYAPLDSLLTQFYGALLHEQTEAKNAEFDALIASCRDSLTRQHVALAVFDHYRYSRVMGEEAVAVHIFDEWIAPGKVSALCGEAAVFPRGNAPEHFFTIVKQHGALLAKGRLLGIQFDALFTDGLYFSISRNAIEKAMQIKAMFKEKGIPLYIDSPTNQQFPILDREQMAALDGKVLYEVWERLPDGRAVTRFATSWCTTQEQLDAITIMPPTPAQSPDLCATWRK